MLQQLRRPIVPATGQETPHQKHRPMVTFRITWGIEKHRWKAKHNGESNGNSRKTAESRQSRNHFGLLEYVGHANNILKAVYSRCLAKLRNTFLASYGGSLAASKRWNLFACGFTSFRGSCPFYIEKRPRYIHISCVYIYIYDWN